MSTTVDDLQAIADRVVAQAGAGEQIEAYVSRGGETAIRIYEGELEHFVSAQSEGVFLCQSRWRNRHSHI